MRKSRWMTWGDFLTPRSVIQRLESHQAPPAHQTRQPLRPQVQGDKREPLKKLVACCCGCKGELR